MKRIMLKLSGEALAGDKKTGFDEPTVREVALQVKQLNGMIGQYVATLASDDVIYVDYYSAMANHEGGLDASLSDDGCHPTPAGYAIMERVVLEALTRWAK